MDKVMNGYTNLVAIGFYPMISVFAFAAWFLVHQVFNKTEAWALFATFCVCVLGQIYYDMPEVVKGAQHFIHDVLGLLFFSAGQTLVAVGLHYFMEAVKITALIRKYVLRYVPTSAGYQAPPQGGAPVPPGGN